MKTNHHAVHYAQRTLWRAAKQMMHKGTGTVYRIVVQSELRQQVRCCLRGMEMEPETRRYDTHGEIIDQPHLYGILDP